MDLLYSLQSSRAHRGDYAGRHGDIFGQSWHMDSHTKAFVAADDITRILSNDIGMFENTKVGCY